jgi:hypothetical protein
MDIIQQCLSLAPVPYLAPAFSVLRFIWSLVEQAQASKQQLQVLAQTIAQLLRTLNREYSAGRLRQAKTSMPLGDLHKFVLSTTVSQTLPTTHRRLSYRLLKEISIFVRKETSRPFLKVLFTKDERIARIEQYHRRIATAVTSFQESRHFLSV